MPSTLRPVSDVVINYPKDDDNTKIVGNISASSPDLSNTSWPNSTNNLLSESEPEDTDGNQGTINNYKYTQQISNLMYF